MSKVCAASSDVEDDSVELSDANADGNVTESDLSDGLVAVLLVSCFATLKNNKSVLL